MDPCTHASRALYRHPYGDVGLFHIVERCRSCGARTRDGWVSHAEAKKPEGLPVDPWINGADPRQGTLW